MPDDCEGPAKDVAHWTDFQSVRGDRNVGEAMHSLASQIYPICRSITGDGVRETLRILGERVPYQVSEVPSGTAVFDWTVPQEWNINDAYILDASGKRIVDFADCNLHVVSYSTPVRTTLSLQELKQHIFTLPDAPDVIPYRTSYYSPFWGFCMAHRQLEALADGTYEAVIESSLEDGSLTYGEYVHPGQSSEEILLSAHICHPSLANDNCSGLALLTELARRLQSIKTRYTYRILLAPGTIGAITWLARNEERTEKIRAGLVMSCVGDAAQLSYKQSRRGTALIDRAMAHIFEHKSLGARIEEFSPYGYDERQYCSPGFNLPVGLLQRSRFGTFPEYHTSGDNLEFLSPSHLADSFDTIVDLLNILDNDRRLINLAPKCEPQLGRRGLYASVGGDSEAPKRNMAMLWVLNQSDGDHTLLDIAERSALPFQTIAAAASSLERAGLLREIESRPNQINSV